MALDKQGNFSQQPSELPDVPSPSMTPDQIRAKWQTPLDELKVTMNNAFDKLNSITDGASGADNIGATGFDGTPSTPQAMLEDLNTRKAEKGTNWTGTWQGFSPSQVDQTIHDQVNQNTSQLADIAIDVLHPPVPQVAIKADDITDDTTAINNILNGVSGKVVILFPFGKKVKVNGTLTVDLSRHVLKGYGCYIDATGLLDGTSLFEFIASDTTPYNNSANAVMGFIFEGSGKAKTATFLNLDTTNVNSTTDISHAIFRDVVAFNFGTGILIGKNAYLENFDHCSFYNMGTIISAPNGYTNSGERISFKNCVFFNSTKILDADNFGDFYFDECSFDYSTTFFNVGGVRIYCDKCHFEFGHGESTTEHLINITKGNSVLSITNSYILGANDVTTLLEFIQVADGSMVVIKDCLVSNVPGSRLVKALGNALVNVENIEGWSTGNHYIPSEQMTFLSDPSFSKSYALNQFTVSVAGSSTVTIDATIGASDTHSIKLYKPNTTNTETCKMIVNVPMKQHNKLLFDFKCNYNITAGANSYDKGYVRVDYKDYFGNVIQTYEYFFSGSSNNAFSLISCQTAIHNSQPPKGTQSVDISISINQQATGTMWVDDLYINVC